MAPIYVKTVYSFLSSLITIDDLINLAKEKQWHELCICDDNMYGVMEFITKCEANQINPIVGIDIGYCLLYAKNYQGYVNLLNIERYRHEKELSFDDLKQYSEHLICLINANCEHKNELIRIYSDYYVYGDSNDCAFPLHKTLCIKKEDTLPLKYLNMLRDNKTLSDDYIFNSDVYFLDIDNLRYQEFFNKCHLKLPKYSFSLPDYCKYNDTKGLNSDEYLYNLAIIGLNKRLNSRVSINYKERLKKELDIIQQMGFSNYFLIVYDYIKYAKTNGILVGPGRGSAAGSLVSFSLGITDVDPLKYDLLFERFLNPSRVTMPDIDTDFPDIRRDEVINYVKEKYGNDHVALITTFGTFGTKMALRDMGRVINVPIYLLDDLCKRIGNMTLDEAYLKNDIKNFIDSDNKLKHLYEVARKIINLPRHSSIHAAGVVISSDVLSNIVPLYLNETKYVIGYEAFYLERLGLLKMDFLGIKNLTTIDNTLKLIEKNKKISLKFSDLPLHDFKTNNLFQTGNTMGIFQFESSGMRDFLIKLKPDSFEDIYNANAFFRPGPSNNIDTFIKRRHGKEKITYYDNRLEHILKSTMGIIVYQEQIMEIAHVMASFTLGEADILRRAMSKKKEKDILMFQDKFIKNSLKNGYDEKIVKNVFNFIKSFASYGFNKSHSVAYSMISYKMAYLKANYPLYFYLSLLDNVSMDEEKTIAYIKEMRKAKIKICKPDINKSLNNYTIYYDSLILPFTIIKGISNIISMKIVEARENSFSSIYDFFSKMVKNNITINTINLLIDAGCLDSFSYNRHTLRENIDNLMNYGTLVKDLGEENVLKPEIIFYEEIGRDDLIDLEKKSFGFYLTNHPVSFYKNQFDKIMNLSDIKDYFNQLIKTIIMVDKIHEITTKNGEKMAFINGSDEETNGEIVLFPKVYETISSINKGDILIIEGRVEKRNDYQIIATKIKNVKEIK